MAGSRWFKQLKRFGVKLGCLVPEHEFRVLVSDLKQFPAE